MEGVLESEGEGDEAPSAEMEVCHRRETEGVIFFNFFFKFPSRVR